MDVAHADHNDTRCLDCSVAERRKDMESPGYSVVAFRKDRPSQDCSVVGAPGYLPTRLAIDTAIYAATPDLGNIARSAVWAAMSVQIEMQCSQLDQGAQIWASTRPSVSYVLFGAKLADGLQADVLALAMRRV